MLQWETRGNLEPAKPCKEQKDLSVGKRNGLVNWEGLQCLSQQTRGLGCGTSGVSAVV